jgi:hypothetical protein
MFMNIKGLDLTEISRRLEKHITDYFTGYTLAAGQCLFAESYLFYFDEVKHIIPGKYHNLFKDTDKFNGASGFIKPNAMSSKSDECVVMLLTDEFYEKAYLLCLQETDEAGKERIIILQDFFYDPRGSMA